MHVRSFLIFSATRNSSRSTVGAKLLPITLTAYWNCWAASAEKKKGNPMKQTAKVLLKDKKKKSKKN